MEKIRLYSAQTDVVVDKIINDGVCFSKEEYIKKKYQECSNIFLTAYKWYISEARKIVPVPEGASYPYWAFTQTYSVDRSGFPNILVLDVPIDEVVFFEVSDWNQVIRMEYLSDDKEEKDKFENEMKRRGVSYTDIMLTSFYPLQKNKILSSWNALFKNDADMKAGKLPKEKNIQAGLWQIKKEWVKEIIKPFA